MRRFSFGRAVWLSAVLLLPSMATARGAGAPAANTAAILPVDRTMSAATAAQPAAPPRISSIQMGGVSPARPVAGQLAQVQFQITTDDAPESAATLRSLLASDLVLMIDQQTVNLRVGDFSIVDRPPSRDGREVIVVSMTFTWPGDPALRSATKTSLIEVMSRGTRTRSSTRLVEVGVEGQESLLWLMLAMVVVLLGSTAGLYYWMRSQRAYRSRFARGQSIDSAARTIMPALTPPPATSADEPEKPAPVAQTAPDTSPPAVPEDLVRIIADGHAVLALGAGASALAGVPTGNKLLLHLIGHFGTALPAPLSGIGQAANPELELNVLADRFGGLTKVMDVIAASIPKAELTAVLAEALSSRSPGGPLLTALAQCPWHAAVSLTWDDLAERAFAEQAGLGLSPMRVATVNDALELPSSSRAGERLLYKPFGAFDRAPTLALTIDEMRRLVHRAPAFQRALAGLYQSHTFLFVGADFDGIEQFLQAITPDFETVGARHYALVPKDSNNALRQTSLGRFGLQLLEYDAAGAQVSLPAFARHLRNAVRSMAAARGPGDEAAAFYLSAARIKRVQLHSIGPFESLDLRFDVEGANAEAPWSVIFGGNGVGKSSILRAIALVLAGDHPGALAAGGRLLRAGAAEGLIELDIGDQKLKTRLTRDLSRVVVTSLQQTPLGSGNALALGFPALRGARSADPLGPSARPDARDPDPADLVALIGGEVDQRLADFKQWLVNTLTLSQQGNARAEKMRDLLNGIIRDIVPGQIESLAPLDSRDFVIRVVTPEGLIPFDDLSQGMASIFNWVGLLAQRLFSICETSPEPSHEPAIVLIDEVDAHLHPEWQRRLVALTRRFFPNVQIIATSHSPLLAGALRAHELVVLERDPVTKIVAPVERVAETFGLPSQDILTSSVFGMTTDRNPDVEDLIEQFFSIFQKPVRTQAEDAKLAELDAKLRQFRYGGVEVPLPPPPPLSKEDMEMFSRRLSPQTEGPAS